MKQSKIKPTFSFLPFHISLWSLAMAAASHSSDFAFTCERVCVSISGCTLLHLRGDARCEIRGWGTSWKGCGGEQARAQRGKIDALILSLSVNERLWVGCAIAPARRIHFQTNFAPRAPSDRFRKGSNGEQALFLLTTTRWDKNADICWKSTRILKKINCNTLKKG